MEPDPVVARSADPHTPAGHGLMEPARAIRARKASIWGGRYDITADGHPVATWEKSGASTGGTLHWHQRPYAVRASLTGGTAIMTAPGGQQVATAHDIGRRQWSIDADGRTYLFRRGRPWRQAETLRVDGQTAGSIRRTSLLRGDAAADLPGLPLPVQLFALTLVLTIWDATAPW